MNPNASEHTCHVYNEFRQLTVHLIDLKATLQSAEFELESIRSKMEEKGMVSSGKNDYFCIIRAFFA